MFQTFPLGGRSAMFQIFRGKVCNVADLPGEGLQCCRSSGGKVCKGEVLQYNTTRTLALSRTHVKSIPDGGLRTKAVEVDTLSEWIKSIADVLKRRLRRLCWTFPFHDNAVVFPVDKASKNYTFVCKRHFISILLEKLGLNSLPGNPSRSEINEMFILKNWKGVIRLLVSEISNGSTM